MSNRADGRRSTLTEPDGTVVGFGYSGRGQVTSVTVGNPPPLATYTYDLAGQRIGKSLENGTFTKASYDDAQRLLALDHQHGGLSFQSFTYALNSVGNRTSRQETVAGGPAVIDRYAYDAIDQVTQVRYAEDPSVGASVRRVDYAFDFAGNRTSVTEDADGNGPGSPSVTSYTANAVNQYTAIDHRAAPAFDANGNTITLQAELGGPVWTYQYDAQNRLIGGTSTAGSQFTFAYDPRNRCVVRKINGVITANLYDDWSLISERDASDQQLAGYIHGANLDEILLRVSATGSTYSHHDGLGSTTALTDSAGNILERYTYDIYGEPKIFALDGLPQANSASGNRFLYTGREWLAELQLNDHRHRYYQPQIGRWLSRDPVGERAGANLYLYVDNESVLNLDPLGLFCIDFGNYTELQSCGDSGVDYGSWHNVVCQSYGPTLLDEGYGPGFCFQVRAVLKWSMTRRIEHNKKWCCPGGIVDTVLSTGDCEKITLLPIEKETRFKFGLGGQ